MIEKYIFCPWNKKYMLCVDVVHIFGLGSNRRAAISFLIPLPLQKIKLEEEIHLSSSYLFLFHDIDTCIGVFRKVVAKTCSVLVDGTSINESVDREESKSGGECCKFSIDFFIRRTKDTFNNTLLMAVKGYSGYKHMQTH